jgi:2-keto-3-deoxy-L-rhamnonate aldolase RhmA
MAPTFRSMLLNHDKLLGTILGLPAPEVAEIFSDAGMDWLWLDMEHGLQDFASVEHITQAVGKQTPCMVRVPDNEAVWFKRVLDLGVAGVVVPLINSAEQAKKAVAMTRYPPMGARSVGISRAHGYGAHFDEYLKTANQDTALIVQVEHIEAVNHIEEILDVPGLDAVFIGPYDLSASMNKPGQIDDPEVVKAITRARQAVLARKMPVGTIVSDAAGALKKFAEGYTFIVVGMDTTLLSLAARQLVQAVKKGA